MSYESPGRAADSDSGQATQNANKNPLKAVKKRRRVGKQLIVGSIGTVFITAAFSVRTWPSIPFVVAGIVCGSWVLYMELQNRSFARPVPFRASMALGACAAVAWLVVFFAQRDTPTPQGHLGLIVRSGNTDAHLTNDFLFLNPEAVAAADIRGVIIIPTAATGIKPTLQLILTNDSPIKLDSIRTVLILDTNLHCETGPGWFPMPSAFKAAKCFGFREDGVLFPADSLFTSDVTFAPTDRSAATFMVVSVKANPVPEFVIGVVLRFDSNFTQLHITKAVLGTNETGTPLFHTWVPPDQ